MELQEENNKTKKFTWSKSVEVNGQRKSVNVEQVENGYIVCVSESGYKEKEDGEKEYYCNDKKFISKENPIEKNKEKEDKEEGTMPMSTIPDMASALDLDSY